MTGTYREDIQRLRGLAVLSVVAFHFEAPAIHGGFVGVDIFFVISGFLITQIIQTELRNGTFSFAQFYERRVRRILPPLYVVTLASIGPAFYYLLTSERQEFFKSIAAVVTLTSNFFFWFQSGYFDFAAVEKPLLHTWSLAVEEQFYLVLPVLLWCLHRWSGRRSAPIAIVLVAATIASFVYTLWLMNNGRSPTAFYMSAPRAWEFLLGGIVALEGFPVLRMRRWQYLVHGAAYGLIFVSLFGLRRTSFFPGWNAVPACVGAAMFIWSGRTLPVPAWTNLIGIFPLIRFFGTISYSMYLWHWPLFAFARFATDGLTLDGRQKIALFALTVLLSWLTWRTVERPFRRGGLVRTQRAMVAIAAGASLALLLLAGAGVLFRDSLSGDDRFAAKLDAYNRFDERAAYRGGSCFRLTDAPIDRARCLTPAAHKTNILLWGDSFAAHYYPGLSSLIDPAKTHLMQATAAGCMPTLTPDPDDGGFCRYLSDLMNPWFDANKPASVVISADWIEHARTGFDRMIANVRATVSSLNARGIPVVMFGMAVQFKSRLPPMLIRAHLRHIDPLPSSEAVRPDIFALDARMKAALPSTDKFTYVSVLDTVCPAQNCPLMVGDSVPLAWDVGHLTIEGSRYVIDRLAPQLKPAGIADPGTR